MTTRDQGPEQGSSGRTVRGNPPPLVVAASLAAVQGVVFVLYGVMELVSISTDRLTVALTTSVFFAGWGGSLLYAARQVLLRESWVRAPLVMSQLVLLGVATSFWGGGTTWIAVLMALVALVTMAGLLNPRSIDALADGD